MKYIIFNDFADIPVPILFPNRIAHLEMREQIPYTTVVAAGYVQTAHEATIRCWGAAPDLSAHSRPEEDARIILKQLGEDDSAF